MDRRRFDGAPKLTPAARLRFARGLLQFSDDKGEDRQAKCWYVRRVADEDATVRRRETWRVSTETVNPGAYSVSNLVQCGRYVCPACGPQLARSSAAALAVAFGRHLGGEILDDRAALRAIISDDSPICSSERLARVEAESTRWHDVWMLSLTIPHYSETPTATTIERLYASSSKLFSSPTWRRFAERWGIVGRVRVLDATFGGREGSHPHFHCALFVTRAGMPSGALARATRRREVLDELREWNSHDGERGYRGRADDGRTRLRAELARLEDADRDSSLVDVSPMRTLPQESRQLFLDELSASLALAWLDSATSAGAEVRSRTEFLSRGARLTPAEHAHTYFTKWGLAEEVGATTSKSNNHLRLLDLVGDGVDVAGDLYLDFRRATVGRTWVTGLGDVRAYFAVSDDDINAYLEELNRKRRLQLEELGHVTVDVRALEFTIPARYHVAAIHALYADLVGWDAVFRYADDVDAAGGDVQTELDRFLWAQLARSRENHPSA